MTTRRELLLAGLATMLPHSLLAATCAPAADISGNGPWFNSPPLSLAKLANKVVLVEFWTLGCYNCRNVEPYVNQWHKRYADQGLVVVGVHTPEFAYEGNPKNVKNYLAEHQITHPVVMDNDYAIWNRWHNRYWPALYLVNASGQVCYSRYGEGAYDRTEREIQILLRELR
jgi:thiol-disulfide isomerase/thioredoxin